jgi:hypothetical protein
MEASKTVWRGLVGQIKAVVPRLHGHQAKTVGLWVLGALVAGSVRIPAVAEALLLHGVTDARLPSVERRLARWLANPRLEVEPLWQACLPVLLRGWRPRTHAARLVLDATPLAERAVVLTVGLWVHGRVLPLAWEVLPGQAPWPEAQWTVVARLFARVRPHLEGLATTVLADRGLVGHPLVALCQQMGWHWVLRLEAQHCCQPSSPAAAAAGPAPTATPTAAPWVRVDQLVTEPGQDWFGPVRLWKKTTPVTGFLSVAWDPSAAQPWYCFSDRPAQPRRLDEYADRFAIEATFQDAKSRGWELEDLPIEALDRLNRLLLVLALTLWLALHYAASCLHHGQRAHLDRHDRRDKGLLRLGRLWFCRCLARLPLGRLHLSLPFHHTPAGWCLPLRF